ncbi:MAG: alpha/beta hydrolase [Burkholderiaceae bacterium]
MSLIAQLSAFPSETVQVAGESCVQFRRARGPGAGDRVTHVLLHGIGSASASWLAQLQQVAGSASPANHVLAWDAPGYGASTALPMDTPQASDYASRLWLWLDALRVSEPVTLVGHSLGALMAGAAARAQPRRVGQLVLLAPAAGYARAPAELREKKLADRLTNLARLGPAGMAQARASAMLAGDASAAQLAFVQHVMAQIDPAGYTQAARMLSGGDLLSDLHAVTCSTLIASGDADTITPPQGCQALARDAGVPYESLGAVGHSCPLQAAAQVNRLLGLQEDAL